MPEMEVALDELETLAQDSGVQFVDTTAREGDTTDGDAFAPQSSLSLPSSSLEGAVKVARRNPESLLL